MGVGAFVPLQFQGVQCRFGTPPGVGHHRHRAVIDTNDLLYAGALQHRSVVKRFQLAAKHRAIHHRGIQHAWHGDIHAVNQFSCGFFDGIQPGQPFAGNLPVFRVFEFDLGRSGEFGRCGRNLSIRSGARSRSVGNDALGDGAFSYGYFPFVCRSLHQHQTRRRAALAHIVLRATDALAAAGGKTTPRALARNTLAGGGVFGGDLGPVTFKLFGHELCQTGQGALPHLGACDAYDHLVIGLNHHPGVHLGRRGTHSLRLGFSQEWHVKTHHQGPGNRRGAPNELAARYAGALHAAPPSMCSIRRTLATFLDADFFGPLASAISFTAR